MGQSTDQADNRTPARTGKVVCISVDATSRAYDLTGLELGQIATGKKEVIYLDIAADGANVYYAFGVTAPTVDNTAAMAAVAATAVFTASACDVIFANTKEAVRIHRSGANADNFVSFKTSAGTATVRIRASSEPTSR